MSSVAVSLKNEKATPSFGKTLVRINPTIKSWSHVTLDSFGLVRVKTSSKGGETKVCPLILVELNAGITTFELLS